MAINDINVNAFHILAVNIVFFINLLTRNNPIPATLKTPCINATNITTLLSQLPPTIHIINHVTLDPKCAYFNAKYRLLHMTIIDDKKNTTDDIETVNKN